MSLIHLARQGFITKSALPNVTRERGTTTGTANLMVYGAGKTHTIGTNTTFTDSSTNNFTVTRNGDTIQATNNPFTGSVYFDGNGDYLSYTGGSSLNFGTSDFTIELWVYLNNTNTYSSFFRPDDNGLPEWGYDFSVGKLKFGSVAVSEISVITVSMPTQQWVHCAISRSGSNLKQFINGVQVGSTVTNSTNFGTTTGIVRVGGSGFSSTHSVLGYISNFRVVKGTAVYTANFSVPTSPLTAITNTSLLLLTAQQGPFRDSSTNNFTVTANGNAAGNGLEPFPVNYAGSAYLDGTGDYLSVANNVALQMGTGVFTIEAWIYRNASGAAHTIYCKGGASTGMVLQVTATNVLRFIDTTTNIDSTGTIAATTWTHVAVVRSGTGTNETKLYINGTQDGQGTVTTDFNQTEESRVGTNRSAGENFAGYISNVRVVKGTAVYTAAFTPPTVPLTAVTNTSLLLLTNNVGPFVDNGPNGFPILRNGDTIQTGFSPFTGQPSAGSGYFDGTGDSLTVASSSEFSFGTGAYTVEMWVYQTARGSNSNGLLNTSQAALYITTSGVLQYYVVPSGFYYSSYTVPLNTWVHVAVVRQSGNQLNIYANGVSVLSSTNSTNFTNTSLTIGLDQVSFNGYISNLRIVKGTALYTSNFTPATAPLPAVPNTSLLLNTDNYTIANSNPTYRAITLSGNTSISTAQYPVGMDRSIAFDGNSDYVQVPNDATIADFGTGDFTIEFFINITSVDYVNGSSARNATAISTTVGFSGNGWNIGFAGNASGVPTVIDFNSRQASQVSVNASVTMSKTVWYHVAVVRSGTVTTIYLNGVSVGSGTLSNQTVSSTQPIWIGGQNISTYQHWVNGYISNVRIVKGSALYTANFTPPSLPLPLSVTVPAYVTNNIYGVYQLA